MAAATLSPDTDAENDPIRDPVTFKEVALLFMETGLPEFQNVTLRALATRLERWAQADELPMQRRRGGPGIGTWVVSYSDMLEAHARRYPPTAKR
jgi:hypothetical protein